MYLSVWRFLGATLLGVMRFIEWPTAARKSLHGWLGSDFDTGEYMIARPDRSPGLTATATTRIHFGLRPNVKRPSPVSRRELSIDVRADAHRRKLGFPARPPGSGFTRGRVVSKAKGVLRKLTTSISTRTSTRSPRKSPRSARRSSRRSFASTSRTWSTSRVKT